MRLKELPRQYIVPPIGFQVNPSTFWQSMSWIYAGGHGLGRLPGISSDSNGDEAGGPETRKPRGLELEAWSQRPEGRSQTPGGRKAGRPEADVRKTGDIPWGPTPGRFSGTKPGDLPCSAQVT